MKESEKSFRSLAEQVAADYALGVDSKFDITFLGVGRDECMGLTVEALRHLDDANVVFACTTDVPWIPDFCQRYSLQFSELPYEASIRREEVYYRCCEKVVDAVLSGQRAVVVSQGSPIRYDRITVILRAWAGRNGRSTKIIHQPSSVDVCIESLGIVDDVGVSVYDATQMILRNQCPDTSMHVFVLTLEGALDEYSIADRRVSREVLRPVRDRLLKFYSSADPVAFLLDDGGAVVCSPAALGEMVENSPDIFGTLYIPPSATQSP